MAGDGVVPVSAGGFFTAAVFGSADLAAGDAGFAGVVEDIAGGGPFFAAYPYLAELTVEHVLKPGYRFGDSFEFGLDLLLDGIEEASRRGR